MTLYALQSRKTGKTSQLELLFDWDVEQQQTKHNEFGIFKKLIAGEPNRPSSSSLYYQN